jgi:oligopeptide/dipeptide ABC transporter ATP-binding protein
MTEPALVEATGLTKRFAVRTPTGRRTLTAVDDVNLSVDTGEILALVGESGCGKSTTGRMLLALERPDEGRIEVGGRDLFSLSRRQLRDMRRDIQPVFQDPYDSLNGRKRISTLLSEPARSHGIDAPAGRSVPELLELVGLSQDYAERFPHELSGGQRQRISIARAIALDPKFLVLDEPVSALDVSVQAQIINLLSRLRRELGLAYVFISHDLALVRYLADETAVMYLGRIVERGRTSELFANPRHPYSQLLLASVPRPRVVDQDARRKREAITLSLGDLPSPLDRPTGCVFSSRCPLATELCHTETPALRHGEGFSQLVACHYAETADIAEVLAGAEAS